MKVYIKHMYKHIPEYFPFVYIYMYFCCPCPCTYSDDTYAWFQCVLHTCMCYICTYPINHNNIYIYIYIQWIQVHPSTFLNMFGVWNHHIIQNYLFIYNDIYRYNIIIQHFFPPAARYLGVASLINCVTFWTRPRDVETGPLWISHDWGMLAIYHP